MSMNPLSWNRTIEKLPKDGELVLCCMRYKPKPVTHPSGSLGYYLAYYESTFRAWENQGGYKLEQAPDTWINLPAKESLIDRKLTGEPRPYSTPDHHELSVDKYVQAVEEWVYWADKEIKRLELLLGTSPPKNDLGSEVGLRGGFVCLRALWNKDLKKYVYEQSWDNERWEPHTGKHNTATIRFIGGEKDGQVEC